MKIKKNIRNYSFDLRVGIYRFTGEFALTSREAEPFDMFTSSIVLHIPIEQSLETEFFIVESQFKKAIELFIDLGQLDAVSFEDLFRKNMP